ncbi:MAG: Gfo/Idh/MocA family oxidoreductase [Actinomycetota bacterium]
MIGIGMIGLGLISWFHENAYDQSGEIVKIKATCDLDQERATQRAARWGATAYTDYRELLADPTVDAVDITVPHHLHVEIARAALQAGKHVILEKPLAPTSADAEELIALARASGVTLALAENTRFEGAYLSVARLLEEGALGDIRLVRTFIAGSEVERLSDTSSWKGRKSQTMGGAILDSGAHSFYLLRWLFGGVETVRATAAQLVPVSEVEDHAIVSGRLVGGGLYTTEYTFTAEIPWTERLEVYGSKGSVVVDQLANPTAIHYRGGTDVEGVTLDAHRDVALWKFNSVAAGVRDFAEALAAGRPHGVDPADGAYALRVAERAYASVAAGGAELSM